MRGEKRATLVFVFVAITVAAARSVTVSVPQGPWVGMYSSFPIVWLTIGLALLILLLLIQYTEISWPVVFLVVILSAIVVVNLSRLWGVPFGVSDPYNHLYRIELGIYRFEQNIYPLFHIFIKILSGLTGLRIITTLGLVGLLASTIGIGLLALVQRRLNLSRRTQQSAVIAGAPLVAAGLIARPYTLAIIFILLFIWIVTTQVRQRPIQIVLLTAGFGTLWLHPVAFLVGLTVVIVAILFTEVKRRVTLPLINQQSSANWISIALVAVLIFAFMSHIFLFSGVGGIVIEQTTDSSPTTTPPPADTPDGNISRSGDSSNDNPSNTTSEPSLPAVSDQPVPINVDEPIITRIENNPVEFVGRSSLALLLLGIAVVVAFRDLLWRHLDYLTIVLGIAGTLVLTLFVILDLVGVDIFGIRRIATFAPLLLFPLLARVLQTQRGIRIGIALLVLINGGAILYESPAVTGGIQNGATSAQVESYRWYGDYGKTSLTSSRSTFRIGRWLHGNDEIIAWADGKWGPHRRQAREARYPWQVTGRPDDTVVISGWDRAQSRYIARETGQREVVVDLQRFQIARERVYDNGNIRFYTPPDPP